LSPQFRQQLQLIVTLHLTKTLKDYGTKMHQPVKHSMLAEPLEQTLMNATKNRSQLTTVGLKMVQALVHTLKTTLSAMLLDVTASLWARIISVNTLTLAVTVDLITRLPTQLKILKLELTPKSIKH